MKMRDELGSIYEDKQFAEMFGKRGKPAEAPANLALVTVMQYVEDMTDRAAADAVRGRIDWKYALGLELDDGGFDYSVLSKFRKRLLENGQEELLFSTMLSKLKEAGLLKAGGKQRTDSTHITGAIRLLNRVVLAGETVRHALDTIAAVAPVWLQTIAEPKWYKRYGKPVHEYKMPKDKEKRAALASQIGADGIALLTAIYEDLDMRWLAEVEAVETLRLIWIQQFYYEGEQIQLRNKRDQTTATELLVSPYDTDARIGQKRQSYWRGYKVHLTECCDAEMPNVITNVETCPAPEADVERTATVHANLAAKQLLPSQHVVDTGYTSGEQIVAAQQQYGVDLLGPIQVDGSWQAKDPQAYDSPCFSYDWDAQIATCPQGKQNSFWKERQDNNRTVIDIQFRASDCQACPAKSLCTTSKKAGRKLTVRTKDVFNAIVERRQFQKTDEFKAHYAIRAGVEGTMSQTAVGLGMRRNRYVGLPKTHLQHLMTATAANLKRTANWLMGYSTAETRVTRFAALALAA